MSHELRTPLTSILGFTEIMIDQEKLTEAQLRFCQKIQNSGMQLLTSLNQLVDLSRLEAGPAELFLQEFSLPEALRETCAAVARQALKREVAIDCELAPDVTTIVSDQRPFAAGALHFSGVGGQPQPGRSACQRADEIG